MIWQKMYLCFFHVSRYQYISQNKLHSVTVSGVHKCSRKLKMSYSRAANRKSIQINELHKNKSLEIPQCEMFTAKEVGP